jgi:transcriptional regulator with XRE-family HTH domain
MLKHGNFMINNFDITKVGSRLKSLRNDRNLSMRELALKADVAVSFISKIESGKTSPTIMTLQKILEALNVTVAEFFTEDEKNSVSDNIVFRHDDMKSLKDEERQWFFTFPAKPEIKLVMTYEEFQPYTQVRELERHTQDICGYIIDGELALDIPGRGHFTALKGDSFYIKSGVEHIAKNDNDEVLKMIVAQIK